MSEVIGAWKRAGRTTRDGVLRELADDPRRVRARHVRRRVRRTVHPGGHARASPRFPPQVDKRTVADLAEWPYPKQQLVPLVEVVHDRLNVEIFRGCTRGCRFCQAGMITRPVRERPEEQVRTMVAGRPPAHRLRRGRVDVAVERGLLGHRRARRRPRQRAGRLGLREPVAAVAARRRVHRRHRQRDPEGPPHGAHVRARRRDVADPAGPQQAHHRGRPVRRGRRRVLAGVAAREALLPRRCADRDGRRHAAGSPSWRANVVAIGRKYTKQASCTASVGGFVPKPHTPFQWFGQNSVDELERKIGLLRGAAPQVGRPAPLARPGGDVRRRDRQSGRSTCRSRRSNGSGGTVGRSRSGASASSSAAGSTRWRPRVSTPTGT